MLEEVNGKNKIVSKNTTPQIVKEIQNFTPPEVKFGYQKVISFTQLSMFNQCPLRWSLQYKDGYKDFTPSIHTVFGSSIHETIQHYLTTFYEKSGTEADKENLVELFEDKFRTQYKTQYDKNNNIHFSDPEELRDFYIDGAQILEYFKKKRAKYFSKRGWYLVGCEIPLKLPPNPKYKNVIFQGHLDIVMYNEELDKFYIIDIKTSKASWGKFKKTDNNVTSQLVLYKYFFSQQFNIPLDKIEIEFFIVKRKLYENIDFAQSRIQSFKPPSGKIKIKQALDSLNNFVVAVFNEDATYIDKNHPNKVSSLCSYCQFNNRSDLCDKENS